MEGLLTPELLPFTTAIALMLVLALVQLLGVADVDLDDIGLDGVAPLDWLNSGRVPLMVLLILFLTCFGLGGVILQYVAKGWFGGPLSPWIAGIAAAGIALPLTRVAGRSVGRIFPRLETTAFPRDALVGLRATVTVGTARIGLPARAQARDPHGGLHQLLVEPEESAPEFREGAEILLTRRIGEIFRAVPVEPHIYLGDLSR